MKISFTAFNAIATATATLSELTRYALPSVLKPMGETTGTMPWFSKGSRIVVSIRSTFPVNRWSTP